MIVSLIAAMDQRGLIGNEAGLPWRLPGDLRRFRAVTLGKPVIMGRTTYQRIGKPLPERSNIVLTQRSAFSAPGCQVARTLPEALALAQACLKSSGKDEVMIIGGGKVYREALPRWDRFYLTIVHGEFDGTTYFPLRELLRQKWRPMRPPETYPADARNEHPHSWCILERAWDAEERTPAGEAVHSRQGDSEPERVGEDLLAILGRGTVD
jgi:dihydrofolate reductase